MMSRFAREIRIVQMLSEMIPNVCIMCYLLLQEVDERVGSHEDQQNGDNQRVDTGRLGDGATQNHGRGDVALRLGLTADGLARLRHGVTFTETGAESTDAHADTCAQSATT